MRLLILAACLCAAPALAQQPMPNMPPPGAAPSTRDYQAAMDKMHAAMMIPYSGDADHDFAAGMIPHHQGAVDMARIELQYGKDPALRRLARQIVIAQDKEIAFLREWQHKHPAH